MNYRRATVEDLDSICKLSKELHDIHYYNLPGFFSESITGLKAMLEYQLMNEIFYVAENEDNKTVGYIAFKANDIPQTSCTKPQYKVIIHDIFVSEEYRGEGVAHELMNKCKEYARACNIKQIELSVFSFNERAMCFYEKEGFESLKITMNYKENN